MIESQDIIIGETPLVICNLFCTEPADFSYCAGLVNMNTRAFYHELCNREESICIPIRESFKINDSLSYWDIEFDDGFIVKDIFSGFLEEY